MKFQFDSSKYTKKTVGITCLALGLSIGFGGGWYAGREALRDEVRNSLTDAFSGVFGGNTNKSNKPIVKKKKQVIDENKNVIEDTSITVTTNEMDNTYKYKLTISTAEKLPDTYGSSYGYITVRCEGNKTDVIVSAVRYLSSDSQTVKMRWDDGSIESEYMSGSTSGQALFSRSPNTFISKASTANKLVLQYSPWRETDEIAVYKFTDQNRKDLKRMQGYCK